MSDADRPRDLPLAVRQLVRTIVHQLVEAVPVGMIPVRGLTRELAENLARTVVQGIDEYGR